jgi:pimeloyl-ACP methyl ester carboxylesterase
LYFHGHPGSRLEARFLAKAADRAGVRLVGVDRPGMGLSTYQSRRRVMDWPGDVAQLADHLKLGRFAVVGFSGGGLYSLACAYGLPGSGDRLRPGGQCRPGQPCGGVPGGVAALGTDSAG